MILDKALSALCSACPLFLGWACIGVLTASPDIATADETDTASHQVYEIRTYLLGEKGDEQAIDEYLGQALLPALKRQGVGPVGVFAPGEADANQRPAVIVVIPYNGAAAIAQVNAKLQGDEKYLSDAKSYLDRGPKDSPYQRISSELLVAMNCMPELNVPSGTLENDNRVYELRLYESANERLGNLKVDMFNNGEVPIFLDCGIAPVFIGQSLVGPQTPNLTYLTVYRNDAERLESWVKFRKHPDWKVLSKVAKYQGTVSNIDKHILVAKSYSQM